MLVIAAEFVIAVVLIVSVPILVWTMAEKFDAWHAGRHRIQTGESFTKSELSGVFLIAAGLAILSAAGWWSTRRVAQDTTFSD
jgi:hypothetical protein